MNVYLAGQIDRWPCKAEMADILHKAGLTIRIGTYSIRVEDCQHFVLQEYGGDLGVPVFDADADSLPQMLSDSAKVSNALSAAKIRHRFELYCDENELVGYFHFNWPQLERLDGDPSRTNCVYCPRCSSVRVERELQFLCVVPELGNLSRYLCNLCGDIITTLPGSTAPGKLGR